MSRPSRENNGMRPSSLRHDPKLRSPSPPSETTMESSDELPDPQDFAAEAITELEAVVDDLKEIVALVEKEEGVEA